MSETVVFVAVVGMEYCAFGFAAGEESPEDTEEKEEEDYACGDGYGDENDDASSEETC